MLRSRVVMRCLVLSALMIGGAVALAVLCGAPRAAEACFAGGGGEAVLISGVPMFKQRDARWADDSMKPSVATLRGYGCLVCCVSMLFAHQGVETTPKKLNRYLGRQGGYTLSGLLKWDPCAAYTSGRVRVDYLGGPDGRRLAREMANGNPVIVKVQLPSGVFHWVLVVGFADGEYLVHDPLGEESGPVKLSQFGRIIYAMRILKKVKN